MNMRGDSRQLFAGPLFPSRTWYVPDGGEPADYLKMTPAERQAVAASGRHFTRKIGGIWLLISGRFTSGNGEKSTEERVQDALRSAFGYPKPGGPELTLNVLLDSPGGSLDSAYATVLYLSAYAKQLNVYVPDRAKSASTLLAVGADRLHMSAFGELGPLDTQIPDPRNPAKLVSALDCYQSVDYVRDFGFKTISAVLPQLVYSTERHIPVNELLDTASAFTLGAIGPMLRSITALDFGGWGRTLRIGEHYARKLLRAKSKDGDHARTNDIAYELVYGYTHHLFPIDYHEAKRIGLCVAQMDEKVYDEAIKVVHACHRKDFVGLLGEERSTAEAEASRTEHTPATAGRRPSTAPPAPDEHPQAYTGIPRAWGGRDNDTKKSAPEESEQ